MICVMILVVLPMLTIVVITLIVNCSDDDGGVSSSRGEDGGRCDICVGGEESVHIYVCW